MAIVGAVYLVISFGSLFYCLYKACKGKEIEKLGILMVLFCSGITMFSFDRANTIIISTALNCVFFLTYNSDKKYLKHIGFICLAISAALKLFPALFGVLLLYKRRYKDALFAIFYGLTIALLPCLWVEGKVMDNNRAFIYAVKSHTELYAGGSLGLSANMFFKEKSLNNGILPIIICFFTVIVAKSVKNEWKQILLLSLAIILTSGQQAWYCLLAIFYPIVLFLNESDSDKKINWVFLVGFIIILSPLQFNYTVGGLVFTSRRVINTVCVFMYIYLVIESGITFIKDCRQTIMTNKKIKGSPA